MEIDEDNCRICLNTTRNSDRRLLLSDDDNSLSETGRIYEDLLNIPLAGKDVILKYVCSNCSLQIKLFQDFKNTAVEAHEMLCNVVTASDEGEIKIPVVENEIYESKSIGVDVTPDICMQSDVIVEEPPDTGGEIEIFYCDEEVISTSCDISEQYVTTDDIVKDFQEPVINDAQTHNFECTVCKQSHENEIELVEHMKKTHSGTKRLNCPLCPKMTYTNEGLEVHLKMHKGLPPYQCTICEKTFKQKVHFNYHMLNHRNERNIICEICKKAFLSKSDLKIHIRMHTDERRYTCDICDKKFRAHTHMVNHRYSHFEKQFQCSVCLQKYISPNTLRTHNRAVHLGVLPYQCEICDKKFKRKHHLNAHYKIHGKKILTM